MPHLLSCLLKDTDPTIHPSLASIFSFYWITVSITRYYYFSYLKKQTKNSLVLIPTPAAAVLPTFPLQKNLKTLSIFLPSNCSSKVTNGLLIVKSCNNFQPSIYLVIRSIWHSCWCLFPPKNTFSWLLGATFTWFSSSVWLLLFHLWLFCLISVPSKQILQCSSTHYLDLFSFLYLYSQIRMTLNIICMPKTSKFISPGWTFPLNSAPQLYTWHLHLEVW